MVVETPPDTISNGSEHASRAQSPASPPNLCDPPQPTSTITPERNEHMDSFASLDIDFDASGFITDSDGPSAISLGGLVTPETSFSSFPNNDDRVVHHEAEGGPLVFFAKPAPSDLRTPGTAQFFPLERHFVPFPSMRKTNKEPHLTHEQHVQKQLDNSWAREDKLKSHIEGMEAHIRDLEHRLGLVLPSIERLEAENGKLRIELGEEKEGKDTAEAYIADLQADLDRLAGERDAAESMLAKARTRNYQVTAECRLGEAEAASLTAETAIDSLSRKMSSVSVGTTTATCPCDALGYVQVQLQDAQRGMERFMSDTRQRASTQKDTLRSIAAKGTQVFDLSRSRIHTFASDLQASESEKKKEKEETHILCLRVQKLELELELEKEKVKSDPTTSPTTAGSTTPSLTAPAHSIIGTTATERSSSTTVVINLQGRVAAMSAREAARHAQRQKRSAVTSARLEELRQLENKRLGSNDASTAFRQRVAMPPPDDDVLVGRDVAWVRDLYVSLSPTLGSIPPLAILVAACFFLALVLAFIVLNNARCHGRFGDVLGSSHSLGRF